MEQITQDALSPLPDAPKVKGGKDFWQSLLRTVLGISISIILTFGTAAIINHHSKQREKHEIVMMVMYDMYNTLQSVQKADSMLYQAMQIQWQIAHDTTRFDVLRFQLASHIPTAGFTETTEQIFSSSIETINTVGNVLFTENVADFYQSRNNFKTMVCESIGNDFATESPIHSLKRTLDFDFCGYAILCNGLLVKMQHLFAQCQQIMGVTDEEIKAYYDERKQIKAGIKDTDTKSSSKMNELMQLQKEIDEARQNGSVQQPKPRQTRPEGTTLP